jgi:hypothetical protein
VVQIQAVPARAVHGLELGHPVGPRIPVGTQEVLLLAFQQHPDGIADPILVYGVEESHGGQVKVRGGRFEQHHHPDQLALAQG